MATAWSASIEAAVRSRFCHTDTAAIGAVFEDDERLVLRGSAVEEADEDPATGAAAAPVDEDFERLGFAPATLVASVAATVDESTAEAAAVVDEDDDGRSEGHSVANEVANEEEEESHDDSAGIGSAGFARRAL